MFQQSTVCSYMWVFTPVSVSIPVSVSVSFAFSRIIYPCSYRSLSLSLSSLSLSLSLSLSQPLSLSLSLYLSFSVSCFLSLSFAISLAPRLALLRLFPSPSLLVRNREPKRSFSWTYDWTKLQKSWFRSEHATFQPGKVLHIYEGHRTYAGIRTQNSTGTSEHRIG